VPTQDFLPRIFQADVARLYEKAMLPTLQAFEPENQEPFPENAGQRSLDWLKVHMSNEVAFEMRKAFALTLAASFERQLRSWAKKRLTKPAEDVEKAHFEPLLQEIIEQQDIAVQFDTLRETLVELHLLANAIRHGDGPSATKLAVGAPDLWTGRAPSPTVTSTSVDIRVHDHHLQKYIRTLIRFWGLADREPGAVLEGPY
jgi:hypothetical protein